MPPARIAGGARGRRGRRSDLLAGTAPSAERLREGALLVLAGRPNAGQVVPVQRAARAPIGRWSPRFRARRATPSRRTPTFWAGRCGWPTPPDSGMRRPDRSAGRRGEPALPGVRPTWCCSASEAGRALGRTKPPSRPSGRRCSSAPRPISRRAAPGEGVAVSGHHRRRAWAALRRAAAERVFGERIALADLEPALDPRAPPHGARAGRRRRWRTRCAQLGRARRRGARRAPRARGHHRAGRAGRGGGHRGGAGPGVRGASAWGSRRGPTCGYAVWIPLARSSAAWNSAPDARSASASPRSATSASVIR